MGQNRLTANSPPLRHWTHSANNSRSRTVKLTSGFPSAEDMMNEYCLTKGVVWCCMGMSKGLKEQVGGVCVGVVEEKGKRERSRRARY